MKIRRHSEHYSFIGDTETGVTYRWGETLQGNPELAPWPELADISISNHCTKNCDFCYRDSKNDQSFISVKDYEYVLNCLNSPDWGNVFQVAIGGGEPLEHPGFLDIIEITLRYTVVPNFTTNGIHLKPAIVKEIEGKVGAVAISSDNICNLEGSNMQLLLESGIRTNIHFLLSRKTLGQGIKILEGRYNHLFSRLNAIIFLTYKPVGRANFTDCLTLDGDLLKFLKLIDIHRCNIKIGFDACFVPPLLHFTDINIDFVDSCECAFFSVYIDETLNVKPCSFANDHRYIFNLRRYSFSEIWIKEFLGYRENINSECNRECRNKTACRGPCPYFPKLTLCYAKQESDKRRYV